MTTQMTIQLTIQPHFENETCTIFTPPLPTFFTTPKHDAAAPI